MIVDIALVDTHQVGKHVEVVGVVISAVYVCLARCKITAGTPHLCIGSIESILANAIDGIPYLHLLALALHVGYHFVQVCCCSSHLVTTDVDIWSIGKYLTHLVEHLLQHLLAILGLHAKSHCALKGLAMARHVNLGNHCHTMLLGSSQQALAVLLCVVLSLEACHGCAGSQLGISLHLKAPCLVLGHVPVEGINLETREQFHLLHQFVYGDERTAHVVHIATQFECRPVLHTHSLQRSCSVPPFCHLRQSLSSTDYTSWCYRSNLYTIGGHIQCVGLVLITMQFIVIGTVDALHKGHIHSTATRLCQCASVRGKELFQQGTFLCAG